MITISSLFRALAPESEGPHFDAINHRRIKFAACCAMALLGTVVLAVSLQILGDRHGKGAAIEWLASVGFTYVIWRAAGMAWFYWTLRLAPWSWEYLRLWWRAAGVRRS